MKRLIFIGIAYFLTASGYGGELYSHQRIFNKAAATPGWVNLTGSEQIMLVRKIASKQKTVSDPVSDRYSLTAYGGAIDLVHFLMLANEACRDGMDIKARLYKEWVAEGGPDHQFGFNPSFPSEAHPDDLPSNALGALFGSEIKERLNRDDFDLKKEFEKFIKPLKPLPDSLAKKFSHRLGVMGLAEKSDVKTERSRYIWFTAAPLNMTALLNRLCQKEFGKNFCKTLKSGTSCLQVAGFILRKYRGKTILVERL